MTKSRPTPPVAGPDTQSAPAATSGGTYGQGDYSRSAQRSAFETDQLGGSPMSPTTAQDIAQASVVRSSTTKPKRKPA